MLFAVSCRGVAKKGDAVCDLFLMVFNGFWQIIVHALGIFFGTALAYYFVVGPILVSNEKRKKNEAIIEGG